MCNSFNHTPASGVRWKEPSRRVVESSLREPYYSLGELVANINNTFEALLTLQRIPTLERV